jgi:hypothetical protein
MRRRNKWLENERGLSRIFRRRVVWLVICGFVNLGCANSLLAQSPSGGKAATAVDNARSSAQGNSEDERQRYVQQHVGNSKKTGAALVVTGLALIAGGGYLVETWRMESSGRPVSCSQSLLGSNWYCSGGNLQIKQHSGQLYGGVGLISGGAGAVIAGIRNLRRHKPSSASAMTPGRLRQPLAEAFARARKRGRV